MKKIYLLVFLFISLTIYSQNRFPSQSFGGLVGGITGKNGYFANINYSKFIGDRGFAFRVDGIYSMQNVKVVDIPSDESIKLNHMMLMPGVSKSFDQLGLDPMFLTVYLGGMGGYEIANDGSNVLPNSQIISDKIKNTIIYGAYGGGQIELEISRSITISLNGTQVYRLNSELGEFSFYAGGGLRFYF